MSKERRRRWRILCRVLCLGTTLVCAICVGCVGGMYDGGGEFDEEVLIDGSFSNSTACFAQIRMSRRDSVYYINVYPHSGAWREMVWGGYTISVRLSLDGREVFSQDTALGFFSSISCQITEQATPIPQAPGYKVEWRDYYP